MNKRKKCWIAAGIGAVLLLFIIVGTCFYNNSKANPKSEEAALASYLMQQDDIMAHMMNQMAITSSGNDDLDFLYGMIPHHEAAIRMSETYLTYGGSNRKLKKIAKEIVKEQTEEVAEMQTLAAKLEQTAATDASNTQTYLDAYEQLMSSEHYMHHGTNTTENVEQAFAEGMIMHHKMAVDMAQAILTTTANEDIEDFAEDIIELEQDEITQMKKLAGL